MPIVVMVCERSLGFLWTSLGFHGQLLFCQLLFCHCRKTLFHHEFIFIVQGGFITIAFDTNIFEIIETTAQRTPTTGVTAPPRAGPVEKPWGE